MYQRRSGQQHRDYYEGLAGLPLKVRDAARQVSEMERRVQQDASHLFAECTKLLGIYPAPYAFHIIPVGNDPMLHRILDF